jgi:hypothetical protein
MTNGRNPMASRAPDKSHQAGAVLVLVLMMLIGITLISMATVNTSVMELRMARNAESGVNNFQTALSAVDFVISNPANLPTVGPLMVPTAMPLTGSVFTVSGGDTITASAARVSECGLPPRMRAANSLMAFSAFNYEITANLNKNNSGMGQTGVVQGFLRLAPKC